MNIKNKKGVTLTILVITIIVMMILTSITITTGTELLRNSQKNKMKTMLYMVRSRAEILLEEYLFNNDGKELNNISKDDIEKDLAGTYITDVNDLKKVGYDIDLGIPDKDKKIYCSWDESVLKSQGIDTKNLAQGDTIIVEYDVENNEVDVASSKGYSEGGVSIHFLSDF